MLSYVRTAALSIAGILISLASTLLGGFDMLLQTLVVFMVIDFCTGWLAAAVFNCSDKTPTGRLSSVACFHGLIKKAASLMIIIVAVYLDALFGTAGLTRDAAIIALSLNELLSIIENMGCIGIKIPAPIVNAMDLLNKSKKK